MTTAPQAEDGAGHPEVTAFFDPDTNTISYVVRDPAGRLAYRSADAVAAHVRAHGLTVEWLIETHVHADHLSAAPDLQLALGGSIAMARASPSFRTISASCSTRARNSSGTAASSTDCSPMATVIALAA